MDRGSLADFTTRLQEHRPFAFSRWGDGEWSCVLRKSGETCDGQKYTTSLRRDLHDVLKSRPKYDLGMQDLALRQMRGEIMQWLKRYRLTYINWCGADVFAHASCDGSLGPLVAALLERDVVVVGPTYLEALPFPRMTHVPVDAHNCHADFHGVVASCRVAIEQYGPKHDVVVAVSAGPSAKVLVHRLHGEYPRAAVVDFGSLWEPYVGHANRKYHRRLRGRELAP